MNPSLWSTVHRLWSIVYGSFSMTLWLCAFVVEMLYTKLVMNRREFLRSAALLSGAAGANWARPISLPGGPEHLRLPDQHVPGPSILELPADSSPVDHVVVLMMENRSFDHYLGWLATDPDYIEQGRSLYGANFSVEGNISQAFKDARGRAVSTYYLPAKPGEGNPYRGCGHTDPGHGWNQGRIERDSGFLAPGSGNDEFAIGYYLAEDLPVYASLARRFTIFDHYHASILGPTFPNREYLHSGQSGGIKDNSLPFPLVGFQWPTIWDKLAKANVPAAYYYTDLPVIGLWGPRLTRFARSMSSYFHDAAAGKLPNVVFIDPSFVGDNHNDDHPFADIRAGQKLVFDILKAFVESPHWRSGALIITYDEWGGFFDHVPPPIFPDDRTSQNDQENFGQSGFRVPTILVSPYARPGFVDHRPYEHTSILRFIEWRFLGAPAEGPGADGDSWFLSNRDRYANNIGASLTPDRPDPETRLEQPMQTISRPCSRGTDEGSSVPESAVTGKPSSPERSPFENALESGYFESVGYKIEINPRR